MWVKLSDDMPEDSATVRSASTCPPCGHSGKHPMADCPLTPGVAIAIAAILDAHPRRLPLRERIMTPNPRIAVKRNGEES